MDPQQFLRERSTDEFPIGNPRRYFHSTWYSERYLGGCSHDLDPWDHYVLVGERSGALPHPLFSPTFYRSQAHEHGGLALEHYVRFGIERMIHPHPLVRPSEPHQDLDWFSDNDDPKTAHLVRAMNSPAPGSTLLRYVLADEAEWRYPNPLFDRGWYRDHIGAEVDLFGDPLAHYLSVGGHRGLPTGRDIEWRPFLDRRPDLLLQSRTPMEHVLLHEAPGSHTFGATRPEALITQALAGDDVAHAMALISAWYLDDVDTWTTISLDGPTRTSDVEVRELSGGLLLHDGEFGTVLGEPSTVHVASSWWASGNRVLLRTSEPSTAIRIDRCVLLDPTRIGDQGSVQSAVFAAESEGIPLVTTAEVADALRLIAHHDGSALDVRVPDSGITAGEIVNNPTAQISTNTHAPADIRVSARGRGTPRSGTQLDELTGRGLLALLEALPSGSMVTVAHSLGLSPTTRRHAASTAEGRNIGLDLLTNGEPE